MFTEIQLQSISEEYTDRGGLILVQEEVMKRRRKRPNPFARILASPLHRLRIVKAKKGNGSYKRRPKHSSGRRFLESILPNFECMETIGFRYIPAESPYPINVR